VVYHDVVRLLLKRKWKKFARFRFLYAIQLFIYLTMIATFSSYRIQFIFFLFHSTVMTLALVLAARKQDPRDYDEGIDIFRGICEALFLLVTLYTMLIECYQFKK